MLNTRNLKWLLSISNILVCVCVCVFLMTRKPNLLGGVVYLNLKATHNKCPPYINVFNLTFHTFQLLRLNKIFLIVEYLN